MMYKIVHENDPSQSDVSFKENKFVLDSLHWHNILRIKHRAPPLSLSIGLCELAQDWANKLAHWDVFYHRNYKSIGENLILKCSSLHDIEVNGEQVTKYWYAEIDYYRFDLPPHLLHTRANQFTQMIWKGSRKFGIGKARSRSGKLIIVANYEPPGNIKDDFHINVLSPFEDFELDFIADNLIPKQRGKLNRVIGKQLRARRKAIWN
uniref:SCP domain-containing protein n=1 Tax=Tetranychus urticae TaxID=32264 RepID=T1JYW8_TETUR